MITSPDSIDINKIGDGGTITTDTCNAAHKVRRLLVKHIDGCVNQQECIQHWRNVWINVVAKAVSKFMNGLLEESLDNISPFLCVSPDLENFIHAFQKEFSLNTNYPKGHGEKFRDWIINKYPNEFIMNTERESGSRQYIITMGDGTIYWNRIFNSEFLDEYICIKEKTNILQQNILTILIYIEIIATSRLFEKLHVEICMPFRWTTWNAHKLAHQNCSVRSMGHEIDILHTAYNDLIDDPRLTHNKSFMMHIYNPVMDEITEFKDYIYYQWEYWTSHYAKSSNTREVPLKNITKEIFTPTERDKQDITNVLEKLTVIGIQSLIDKLEDYKKATYKYLSISGS